MINLFQRVLTPPQTKFEDPLQVLWSKGTQFTDLWVSK